MKGNPFFTQQRPGKKEKIFRLIKFRTMDNRKDKSGNLLPDEVRLNKYGRFLRSTSLDELPELLNILKGDMKIILDTVKTVLSHEGISSETVATMEEFMGTPEGVKASWKINKM